MGYSWPSNPSPNGPVHNRLRILLSAVFCFAGLSQAGSDFDLVNRLRVQAGLPTLAPEHSLSAAAVLHAGYLDSHRQPGDTGQGLSAHEQRHGKAGFSGETPAARSLAAGYPHREVLENVSMGYADADSAISGLMSAVYHRLTFLDFEADSLGVAVGEHSRVFMLGREDVGRLCDSPPDAARYRQPVACLGQSMTRDHYEALCADLPPAARFRPPHPITCANGVSLEASFMAGVCRQPPPEARFRGHGRYFVPCNNGTRVDADWFGALCDSPPAEAAYDASGSYYEICETPVRVHAEWLEAVCTALPPAARYTDSGRYRRPCAGDMDIRVEYLDGLDAAKQAQLPDVVVWPPRDAAAVPPAFFIEEPDPLPDLEVSGYPLSIQFNPAVAQQVDVLRFDLFRLEGDGRTPVEEVRLIDRASDPNQLLSAHEFVLFPLRRLAWGARYGVVVEAQLDGRVRRLEWQFKTEGQGLRLLTASRPTQRFVIRSGLDYLLYLPPQEGRAYTVLSSRTEHLSGNSLELAVVDPNTLRVRAELRYCDRIRVQFDDERLVELVPVGCP